jgi:hypothetical protein
VEDESHRLAIIGAPQRAQRIDRTGLDASPLNSHVHLWGGLFTALSKPFPKPQNDSSVLSNLKTILSVARHCDASRMILILFRTT